MPKLIYVYGDDRALLNTLLTTLRNNGYSLEYTQIDESLPVGNISADIALICRPNNAGNTLSYAGITVDLNNLCATTENGDVLRFTPTEFALLTHLMRNSGRAVSRKELLTTVWKFQTDTTTRVADDTVKRLRKKLAVTRLSIDTLWGYGFRVSERDK